MDILQAFQLTASGIRNVAQATEPRWKKERSNRHHPCTPEWQAEQIVESHVNLRCSNETCRKEFEMRSKRLRPGRVAVSNGLRGAIKSPLAPLRPDGPEGSKVRRMGWPAALAPSNSRMARSAAEMLLYETYAVPDERPALS